jgi:hypothetical protein
VSDADLVLELAEAVRNDSEKPVLEQRFNPIDPVAIEIVLHEADFAVERYMEKWESFRERFADPSVYDAFVRDFQTTVRKDVKAMVSAAQQFIADQQQEDFGEGDDEELL